MAYQVLARKWRPQTFAEIIGQETATTILTNAISQNRIAHAFLFAGTRGVGKTTTARVLAKSLNCHEGITVSPCNHCPACLEITTGSCMDVLEIDGASNRGIDEIRDLRENARYSPSRDRHKIFIIDEVHMLTPQAFNALLKTLEEPPPHVIFILATTELHKIPVTIVSRCQLHEFKRIAAGAIAGFLARICREEGMTISERSLQLITRSAGGSMRDALSALDQVISFCGTEVKDEQVLHLLDVTDFELLDAAAAAVRDGDAPAVFSLVARLQEKGHDLTRFCRDLTAHFRNHLLVKVRSGADEPIREGSLATLSPEELTAVEASAERFSEPNLVWCIDLLLKTAQEIRWSSQPGFLLETTLIKLAQQEKLEGLERILQRLGGAAGGSATDSGAETGGAGGGAAGSSATDSGAEAGGAVSGSAVSGAMSSGSVSAPGTVSGGAATRDSASPGRGASDGLGTAVEAPDDGPPAMEPGDPGPDPPGSTPADMRPPEPPKVPASAGAKPAEPAPPEAPATAPAASEPTPSGPSPSNSALSDSAMSEPAPTETPPSAPPAEPSGAEGGPQPGNGLSPESRALLERVKAEKPSLHAMLTLSSRLAVGTDEIRIGFSKKKSFFRENLSNGENMAALKTISRQHFGREMKILVEEHVPTDPEIDRMMSGTASPSQENGLKNKALQEPLVQKALDLFGGEILSIEEA